MKLELQRAPLRRALALAGVLAAALAAAPALAQEPGSSQAAEQAAPDPRSADLDEAGRRYEAGLTLYSEGEFALAVIEFERAYSVVPDYRVLFNIGQVRIQLVQYARARRALERYLADGADSIGFERRASVEADLTMLAARTATLRVDTNVAGAEVLVDGEPVGRSPLDAPLLLDAGEHRVVVKKPGHAARESHVTLAGRDAVELRLELRLLPKPAPPPVIIAESRPFQETASADSLMWAAWSATGALAVGAGITGFLGLRAAGDLDALRSDPDATRTELDSTRQRARSLLVAADVLAVAALVGGGTALYLTLSRDSDASERKPEVGLVLGPGFASVSGRY